MTANLSIQKKSNVRWLFVVKGSNHSELLEKVAKDRCRDSYHLLFKYYAPKVFQYGLGKKLNESQCADLVQEVLTKVWLKADQYSSEKGKVSTWIFTITRNLCFDLLRKNVRESQVVSAEDIWGHLESAPSSYESEEVTLRKKEVQRHLSDLPDEQRDAVLQVYFEGYTQEEYSQKSGLPLGTVKSRLRLALRKLNKLMGDL